MCAEHAVLPQRPIIARVNSYSIICDHNFRYIFIFSFFFFSYFSFIAFHFFLSVKTNKLSGDKSEMQFERKRTIIVTIQLVASAVIISIRRCRIIISRFDYFLFDLAPHLASYYPRFSYHRCSTPSHFTR